MDKIKYIIVICVTYIIIRQLYKYYYQENYNQNDKILKEEDDSIFIIPTKSDKYSSKKEAEDAAKSIYANDNYLVIKDNDSWIHVYKPDIIENASDTGPVEKRGYLVIEVMDQTLNKIVFPTSGSSKGEDINFNINLKQANAIRLTALVYIDRSLNGWTQTSWRGSDGRTSSNNGFGFYVPATGTFTVNVIIYTAYIWTLKATINVTSVSDNSLITYLVKPTNEYTVAPPVQPTCYVQSPAIASITKNTPLAIINDTVNLYYGINYNDTLDPNQPTAWGNIVMNKLKSYEPYINTNFLDKNFWANITTDIKFTSSSSTFNNKIIVQTGYNVYGYTVGSGNSSLNLNSTPFSNTFTSGTTVANGLYYIFIVIPSDVSSTPPASITGATTSSSQLYTGDCKTPINLYFGINQNDTNGSWSSWAMYTMGKYNKLVSRNITTQVGINHIAGTFTIIDKFTAYIYKNDGTNMVLDASATVEGPATKIVVYEGDYFIVIVPTVFGVPPTTILNGVYNGSYYEKDYKDDFNYIQNISFPNKTASTTEKVLRPDYATLYSSTISYNPNDFVIYYDSSTHSANADDVYHIYQINSTGGIGGSNPPTSYWTKITTYPFPGYIPEIKNFSYKYVNRYVSDKVYSKGNTIVWTDGNIYQMIDQSTESGKNPSNSTSKWSKSTFLPPDYYESNSYQYASQITAVGGKICSYSTDSGTTFTNTSSNLFTSSTALNIGWNGNMYVAVGISTDSSESCIKYSTNGRSWVNSTKDSANITGVWKSIGWDGNMWVAVGTDMSTTTIIYSNDGIIWNKASGTGFSTNGGFSVTSNGFLWVATGDTASNTNGAILISSDGINWSATTGNVPGSITGQAVAYNGKQWVLFGQRSFTDGIIFVSYDGLNWYNSVSGNFSGKCFNLDWNGSIWVAVGQESNSVNAIKFSKDGYTWTNSTSNPFTTSTSTNQVTVTAITFTGTKWIAIGSMGGDMGIATSSDAKTWTSITSKFSSVTSNCGICVKVFKSLVLGSASGSSIETLSAIVGYPGSGTNASLPGNVQLSWTGASEATSYKYYESGTLVIADTEDITQKNASFHTGVTTLKEYTFSVQPITPLGKGTISSIKLMTAPGKVTNVQVIADSITQTGFSISHDKIIVPSSITLTYKYYLSTTLVNLAVTTPSSTTAPSSVTSPSSSSIYATFNNLNSYSAYTIVVSATISESLYPGVVGGGGGAISDSISITTLPDSIILTPAIATSTSITFGWPINTANTLSNSDSAYKVIRWIGSSTSIPSSAAPLTSGFTIGNGSTTTNSDFLTYMGGLYGLTNISVDFSSTVFMGVDTNKDVWFSDNKTPATKVTGNLPKGLVHVCYANNIAFGRDNDTNTWYSSPYSSGTWILLIWGSGEYDNTDSIHISWDGITIGSVNPRYEFYYSTFNKDVTLISRVVSGKTVQASMQSWTRNSNISCDQVYLSKGSNLILNSNNIYSFSGDPGTPTQRNTPGSVFKVSYDSTNKITIILTGTGSSLNNSNYTRIYYTTGDIQSTTFSGSQWVELKTNIITKIIDIAYSTNKLFVLDSNNDIWYSSSYNTQYNSSSTTPTFNNLTNQTRMIGTFTGLTSGTTYNFAISVKYDASNNDKFTTPVIITSTTLPGSMGAITQISISSNTIKVSWEPVTGATSYKYICKSSTTDIATLTSTECTSPLTISSGLNAGQIYNIIIYPFKDLAQGASGEFSFILPPVSVTNLTATPDSTEPIPRYTIAWTACNGATNYRYTISPAITGTGIPATPFTNNSLVFSGLNSGTDYTITIIPYNHMYDSANPTSTITGTEQIANHNPPYDSITIKTPHLAITGLTVNYATITTSGFVIQWPVDSTTSNYLFKYPVVNGTGTTYTTFSPNPTVTSNTTLTTATFTGLTASTRYTVVITPVYPSGNGTNLPTQVITTLPPAVSLIAPSGINLQSNSFVVNWTKPVITPNNGGVDVAPTSYNYTLSPAPPSGALIQLNGATTSSALTASGSVTSIGFTCLNMKEATTYTVTINPVIENINNGSTTTTISGGTPANTVVGPSPVATIAISTPSIPLSPQVEPGFPTSTTCSVRWPITSGKNYVYCLLQGNLPTIPSGNTPTYVALPSTSIVMPVNLGTLDSNTSYTIFLYEGTLTSKSILDHSSFTTLPGTITSGSITISDKLANGFTAVWSNPSPGTSALKYQCYLNNNLFPSEKSDPSVDFNGLTPGTQYTLSITPVNSAGALGNLVTKTVWTLPEPISTTPRITNKTKSSFIVDWSNTSCVGATKFSYTISPNPSDVTLPGAPNNTITPATKSNWNLNFSGLSPGINYTITIIPKNANDDAGIPISVATTTLPAPIEGDINIMERHVNGFNLTWLIDSSATGYEYYINGTLISAANMRIAQSGSFPPDAVATTDDPKLRIDPPKSAYTILNFNGTQTSVYIIGLDPGTRYLIEIIPYNINNTYTPSDGETNVQLGNILYTPSFYTPSGVRGNSSSFYVTTLTDTVRQLNVQPGYPTLNMVKINWEQGYGLPPSEYNYNIAVATNNKAGTSITQTGATLPSQVSGRTSQKNITFTNLSASTTYIVTINQQMIIPNEGFNPGNSNTTINGISSSVTFTTKPKKMTGLKPTSITKSTIALKWDNVPNLTYNLIIYRETDHICEIKNNVTGSTYTLTSLIKSTEYQIIITPINNEGVSGEISYILCETLTDVVDATAFWNGTITQNSIEVNWFTVVCGSYDYSIKPDPGSNGTKNIKQPTSDQNSVMVRFSGLAPGTVYTISVLPKSAPSGIASGTSVYNVTTITAPVVLAASNITSSSFTISWTAPTGAAYYNYYLMKDDNTNSDTVANYPGTSITFTGLIPGRRYNVSVTPYTIDDIPSSTSTLDNAIRLLPQALQNYDSSLTASNITANGFMLSWFNDPSANDYIFYSGTDKTKISTPVNIDSDDTFTTAVFTSLTASTTYNITVVPTNESGLGIGDPISVTTQSPSVSNINIKPGSLTSTGFILTFDTVSTNSNYSFTFNNITTTPAPATPIITTSKTEYTFSGLENGALYNINIYSTATPSGTNYSSYPVTTLSAGLSGAITIVSSQLTYSTIGIAWTGANGAESYTCSCTPASGAPIFKTYVSDTKSSSYSYIFRNLVQSTAYNISVTPINAGGSGVSGTVTASTPANNSTIQVYGIDYQGCNITWTPVSTASSYTYTGTPAFPGQSSGFTTNARSIRLDGLNEGTTYTFSLTTNTIGSSTSATAAPATISFTTLPHPIDPGSIEFLNLLCNGFDLKWGPSSGATSYIYTYQLVGSDNIVSNTSVNSYAIISNLPEPPGSSYTVTIIPVNGSNQGSSGSQSAMTLPITFQTPPTIDQSSITTTSFTINWQRCDGATSYSFKIDPMPSTAPLFSSVSDPTTTLTLTNLTAGTSYTVTIIPTNASGPAIDPIGTSGVVIGITLPLPVTGLTASSITSTSFNVVWLYDDSDTTYTFTLNNNLVGVEYDISEDRTKLTAKFITLSPGTSYIVGVTPDSGPSAGQTSTLTVLTTANAISTIFLNPNSLSTTGFAIYWNPVRSATSYTYTCTPSKIASILPTVANPLLQYNNLLPGTKYTITVAAVNASGTSASKSIEITTLPNPVSNLRTSYVSATNFKLSWDKGTGDAAYLYTVGYYSSSTNNFVNVTSSNTANSYLNQSGLLANTVYTINIIPVNSANGQGDLSSILVETYNNSLVTDIEAISIDKYSFMLAWSADPTVTYAYTVSPPPTFSHSMSSPSADRYAPSTSNIITIPATLSTSPAVSDKTTHASNLNLIGLESGTLYKVTISTIGQTGTASKSSEISVTTLTDEVTLERSQLTSFSFTLSWRASPNAAYYSYTVTDSSNSVSSFVTTNTYVNFLNLNANTAYNISVFSCNKMGVPSHPSTILVTTLPNTISELTASFVSNSGFTLEWPDDPNVVSYTYTITDSVTTNPVTPSYFDRDGTTNMAVFINLFQTTTYSVTVTSTDINNNQTPTSISITTTPSQSTGFQLKPGTLTSTGFSITWDLDSTATSYKYTMNGSTVTASADTPTSASFTNLESNTTYTVSITPRNSSGWGQTSPLINITTLPSNISSISIVPDSVNGTGFSLQWPKDPNVIKYLYSINNSTPSDNNPNVGSTETSETKTFVSFINLNPGTQYKIGITPLSSTGDQGQQTSYTLTTGPSKITGLTAPNTTILYNGFTLQWTKNVTATSYIFQLINNNTNAITTGNFSRPSPTITTVLQPPSFGFSNVEYFSNMFGFGKFEYFSNMFGFGEKVIEHAGSSSGSGTSSGSGSSSGSGTSSGSGSSSGSGTSSGSGSSSGSGTSSVTPGTTEISMVPNNNGAFSTVTLTGLTANTSYTVKVIPVNNGGQGIATPIVVTTAQIKISPSGAVSSEPVPPQPPQPQNIVPLPGSDGSGGSGGSGNTKPGTNIPNLGADIPIKPGSSSNIGTGTTDKNTDTKKPIVTTYNPTTTKTTPVPTSLPPSSTDNTMLIAGAVVGTVAVVGIAAAVFMQSSAAAGTSASSANASNDKDGGNLFHVGE
jgi:hypothetical protein